MAATQAGKRAIVAEPKTMAAVVGNHICAVAVDYVSVCHYQSHEHQRVVTGYEMLPISCLLLLSIGETEVFCASQRWVHAPTKLYVIDANNNDNSVPHSVVSGGCTSVGAQLGHWTLKKNSRDTAANPHALHVHEPDRPCAAPARSLRAPAGQTTDPRRTSAHVHCRLC